MDRRLVVLLTLLAVLAVGGFFYGSSDADYSFDGGLRHLEVEGSDAPTYSGLRDRNDLQGEVAEGCEDCHADRVGEASSGQRRTHPVGLAVPKGANVQGLLESGSQIRTSEANPGGEVGCRTCHRPHGVEKDTRLVVTADEGKLCLSCHLDKTPARSSHPTVMHLSAAAQAWVAELGGPEEGGLSCLSCHDPHESSTVKLLRTDGQGNTACRSCHVDKAKALGRGHGGETCFSCHGMHTGPKSTPVAAGVAEDGRCLSCHEGQEDHGHPMWVEADDGGDGKVGCWDCHQPHSSAEALPAKRDFGATCTACHAEEAALLGGPHDGTVNPVDGERKACVTCHAPHTEATTDHPDANPASARCLDCHEDDLAAWTHSTSLLTTTSGLTFEVPGPSPYFDKKGQRTQRKGELTCQTCHDQHSDSERFLRPEEQLVPYCGVCHGSDGDQAFRGFHDPEVRKKLLE